MVGMLSDIGNTRKINQDFIDFAEDEFKRIYVVADGMGGHKGGEVASVLAARTIISKIKPIQNFENIEMILVDSIKEANLKIYNDALEDSSLKGMGTTLTCCLISGDEIVIANIGDSSGYILKNGHISKITKDHSFVQQLLDIGTITEAEAVNHPKKSIITRALGTNNNVEVDTFKMKLQNIEKVVLCTDGLTNDVNLLEMSDVIHSMENDDVCRYLVSLSKQNGGRDNISVIVFEGECKNDRNDVR